jgi:hypothetical protein
MRLAKSVTDERRLLVRRKGDVDDLDPLILDQCFWTGVGLLDPPVFAGLPRTGVGARGDGDDRKAPSR